jgi:SAM-dependent methyltransferase
MTNLGSFHVRRTEWESFANENPYHYICTDLPNNDGDGFWLSGEQMIRREILPLLDKYDIERRAALEMGCGVGRLALALAPHFQKVLGLDIAGGMISRASAAALGRRIDNATFIKIDDPGRIGNQLGSYLRGIDLVYSYLVFQHIDSFEVIDAYLNTVGEVLSPDGIAFLQFDTRPKNFFYYAKGVLPDTFLPRNWRRGIRRIRREAAEIEACFDRAALDIVESIAPHTDLHRYVVRLKS